MTARFAAPVFPGGRMCLLSGANVTVGAVFPPAGTPRGRHPWVWRMWIGDATNLREGRARTEGAAKVALATAWRDWCRRAGLREIDG